jgi:methylmalonyl-CoA mutase
MDPMPNSPESTIPLAAGFPSLGEADWQALVRKSAHGRTKLDLASQSDDGIAIGPIYTSDVSGEIVSRRNAGPWHIVQRIDLPDVGDALRQIAEDIAGGATAIELVFAGSPTARGAGLPTHLGHDLDRLAALLRQNAVAVRVDAGEETPAVTAYLMRRMLSGGWTNGPQRLSAAFDPFATMAMQGGLQRRREEIVSAILDLFDEFDRSGVDGSAITADGRLWHAGGASEVQELAAALAAYVGALRLLDDHGLDLARSAARIGLSLAADADQFLTIAKFRAARLLVGRVLESAGLAAAPAVHAETAWRMLSRDDAHTNILRTTTAALAAGLGGADSVTVLPFDSPVRLPDRFARRVARNSQTILIDEASLATVADPGAGAGAVEALTSRLAQEAWDRFRMIEAEGGLLAALRAGTLQRAVAAMRERRLHRVVTRALPLTGVTTFPGVTAAATDIRPIAAPAIAPLRAETVEPLVVTRLAEPFEALRDRADQLAAMGRRPTVFLAILGRSAESTALASAVRQLFASGGFAAVVSPALASAEAAGAGFDRSGAAAACVCPTPQIDEPEIAAVASTLRAKGATQIGLAGRGGTALFAFDYVIERDTNVVELLGNILERIAARTTESPRTQ